MDKLYRVVIIDDDEFSADNLCLELKKYNRLSIDGMARNGAETAGKGSSGLAVSGRGIAGHEGHGTAGTAKGGNHLEYADCVLYSL